MTERTINKIKTAPVIVKGYVMRPSRYIMNKNSRYGDANGFSVYDSQLQIMESEYPIVEKIVSEDFVEICAESRGYIYYFNKYILSDDVSFSIKNDYLNFIKEGKTFFKLKFKITKYTKTFFVRFFEKFDEGTFNRLKKYYDDTIDGAYGGTINKEFVNMLKQAKRTGDTDCLKLYVECS